MFGIDPYYIAWLFDLSRFYRSQIKSIKRANAIQHFNRELQLVEAELEAYADMVWTVDKVELI